MILAGEYEATERAMSAFSARMHFLTELDRVEPEVEKSLLGDVLPIYKAAPVDELFPGKDLGARRGKWGEDYVDLTWQALGRRPSVEPVREALLAWARRWHLETEWMLDWALSRMEAALQKKRPSEREGDHMRHYADCSGGMISMPVALVASDQERGFAFQSTTLDLAIFTRKMAEAKLRHEFEQALEAHFKRQDELAQAKGFVRARTLRNRGGSATLHLEWLVRFQVSGWDVARIADDFAASDPQGQGGVSEDAIKKAVRDKAKWIDLPLRPAP